MKKYALTIAFGILLFSLNTSAIAESTKIITLKDGSVLKGKVIEFYDGTYTFETSNLGNLKIPEADVLSISSPEAYSPSTENSNSAKEIQKAQLKNQVEQMQGTILSDQEITGELQKLVEDEEIQGILSDPSLLNDVMSFDQDKIQQNDGIQQLMNNPKMQDVINKIQQKIPAQ